MTNLKKIFQCRFLMIACFAIFFFGMTEAAFAQIAIKLVAINPSDTNKTIPVKFFLPKELKPEDIIDIGGFKMDYDVERGAYYIQDDISFQAKESKTFKVMVKDVWKILPQEIDLLKKQLGESLALLEKTSTYDMARQKHDHVLQRIDFIYNKQANYPNDAGRRIEEYRADLRELDQLRRDVFAIDYLEREAKVEEVQAQTIKFVIEVKNPSDTKTNTVNEKHYLPEEIREEHVLDSQGFAVRFDEKDNKAFLSKESKFAPNETKKYTIVLKDIWWLPLGKVDTVEERVKLAMDELSNSMYAESAEYLAQKIRDKLDLIRVSQVPEASVKKHIGTYRINMKRYQEADEDTTKLEQMMALVRAKRLKELEEGKVKNILSKLKALRGLAALSDAIFKKKLSVTMTWRIILSVLGFIGFFTALNYITWMQRSKVMGEEHGPQKGETVKEVPKPGAQEEAKA